MSSNQSQPHGGPMSEAAQVNAPQIGEIEREAHAVVEAQQERRDDAALA